MDKRNKTSVYTSPRPSGISKRTPSSWKSSKREAHPTGISLPSPFQGVLVSSAGSGGFANCHQHTRVTVGLLTKMICSSNFRPNSETSGLIFATSSPVARQFPSRIGGYHCADEESASRHQSPTGRTHQSRSLSVNTQLRALQICVTIPLQSMTCLRVGFRPPVWARPYTAVVVNLPGLCRCHVT